jgi:CBS domain-containing protein
MSILHILNEKGRDVVTAEPAQSLADVVAVLADHRIGAVVVVERGAVQGILSERDIIHSLSAHGTDALKKSVRDCMTPKVITCSPTDTIHDVMQKMTAGRFRHVPVMENGRLMGIISIGDVVKRRIQEVESEANSIRDYIATA